MKDQRVPLLASLCFAAAFVSFRGCFQFMVATSSPSNGINYTKTDILSWLFMDNFAVMISRFGRSIPQIFTHDGYNGGKNMRKLMLALYVR